MELLFVLFLFYVGAQVAGALGKKGEGNALPPGAEAAPPDAHLPAPDAWWEEAHGEADEAEAVPDFEAAAYEPEPVEIAPYEPPAEQVIPARPFRAELSMEGEVDRQAEHSRFHARIDRPAERVQRPASARDTLGGLRGGDALRRAVLAAEVLGPPRALRDLGE
jgi:hypothetical protein